MDAEGASDPLTSRVVDGLYTEALLLADEARAYFDGVGRDERQRLDPLLQIGLCCESLKVTTRLMHVVAWLVARRGGGEGAPLGEAPACDAALVPQLPRAARDVIEASVELHARIRRIDAGSGEGAPASPARGLLSRLERAF